MAAFLKCTSTGRVGFCFLWFYVQELRKAYFCGRVPWLYQYWPGGFMLFVVLCPGTPEGSTGSGSGFKASQKTGQRLKVSSDRLAGSENAQFRNYLSYLYIFFIIL